MSDSEDEDDGPVVELGDGPVVEGAPLARVASRLTWPIERERLLQREGDAEIRTPDGPQALASLLDGVETTYFDTRHTFVDAVRDEIGRGPVHLDADGTTAGRSTADTTETDDGATPADDGTAENGDESDGA